MVAKFLDLNNVSSQRRPFPFSKDGRKVWATVLFLSAKSHMSFLGGFCFCQFCRTTVSWDPDILLPRQRDVTNSPIYLSLLALIRLKKTTERGRFSRSLFLQHANIHKHKNVTRLNVITCSCELMMSSNSNYRNVIYINMTCLTKWTLLTTFMALTPLFKNT